MSERNNFVLARVFGNIIWPGYRDFLATAHALPVEELRVHPKNAALDAALRDLLDETTVEKVKIYAPDGLTVYSTDPSQIGVEYGDNPRFLAAKAGGTASLLEYRKLFGSFDGPIENRWILSSYVPVRSGGVESPLEGVAELYRDVTEQYLSIERENALDLAMLATAFISIFVTLLAIVWRTERSLLEHHRRETALATAVARVEATAKEKSTFLANMNHQLRTPLNAILGFAHMIAEERVGPIGNSRYKEYAGDIASAGDQLLGMINDVLLLVRVDAGLVKPEIAPIDLSVLAMSVVEAKKSAATAAEVKLTIELAAGLPPIESDDALIRQVFLRLIDNAIKFTPRGGEVNVGFIYGEADNRVSAYVADTGIGMRPEDIPAALAPFGVVDGALSRPSETGVGLGLSLAGRLAETAGATLSIRSEIGAGTRVTVSFVRPTQNARRAAA